MQAFAEAWARAYNCEKTCIVEVDAAVSSIGEVLVTAATEAYAHVCAGTLPEPSATFLAAAHH